VRQPLRRNLGDGLSLIIDWIIGIPDYPDIPSKTDQRVAI
jgi:hypothetical protein